ncbi:MAG: hypothetical protein ACYSR9_10245, partial [Planctomycetota bacterium]
YKRVTKFDLAKFESAIGIFAGASSLFSFTGISFKLSRKILDVVRDKIDRDDIKSLIIYDFSETLHHYLQGNWKAIKDHNEDLFDKNMSIGEIYWSSQHLHWHCLPKIYQGHIKIAKLLIKRLNDIYEVYENDFSLLLKLLANTALLMECRKLPEALTEIKHGIEFAQKNNQGLALIHMYSCKAHIQILMGDINKAAISLKHANTIRHEVVSAPWQLSVFRRSKLEYHLRRLEESKGIEGQTGYSEHRRKALKSCTKLLKQTRKVAQHRTEAYRLTGLYYWFIHEQKKACGWWHKAIKEGERLDARLELSRTYFEVGKRLLESESKYKKLNGIKAQAHIEKAKLLFEEMDLQWDLDELARQG